LVFLQEIYHDARSHERQSVSLLCATLAAINQRESEIETESEKTQVGSF